jgi:hypothetical protein
MRLPGSRDARFHDCTLWLGNGKRVETKPETKSFPRPAPAFLFEKMKIRGNEGMKPAGNERCFLAIVRFLLSGDGRKM